jgi:hypothetical protein
MGINNAIRTTANIQMQLDSQKVNIVNTTGTHSFIIS